MPADTSRSLGRTPKPPVIDESYRAATLSEPSGALSRPHVSRPGTVCAAGFWRLQSTLKFPFVSIHCREALLIEVFTRLLSVAMFVDSLAMYWPMFARTT